MKLRDVTRAALLTMALVLAMSLFSAGQADEIDRIREKSEELAAKVRDAWYKTLGNGDKPEIERAHKDYAYLLGAKKLPRSRAISSISSISLSDSPS